MIFKGEIALSLSFSVMNGSFIPHGSHLVSLLLFMPKTSGRLSFQLRHFLKVETRGEASGVRKHRSSGRADEAVLIRCVFIWTPVWKRKCDFTVETEIMR